MTLKSLTPVKAICKVLGMGVAVKVKTWTPDLSSLSLSLCATLIHDEQGQVLKINVFGQQSIRPDDDVRRSFIFLLLR